MASSEERVRALLEQAAKELERRREDVLSSTVIWPDGGLDADDCAALLLAIDEQRAVLDGNGFLTVPRGRFRLLCKSGVGVGVDVRTLGRARRPAAG